MSTSTPKTDREVVSREQANARMPSGEYVHTFQQVGGILLGCDMKRDEILAYADQGRLELSGPSAEAIKHGLCILAAGMRPTFVETKENDVEQNMTDSNKPGDSA